MSAQNTRWLLLTAATCLLAFIYFALSGPQAKLQIDITTHELDFGEVNAGEERQMELVVSNPGDMLLEVGEVSTLGIGFSVQPAQLRLEPGKSETVRVTCGTRFAAPASAGGAPSGAGASQARQSIARNGTLILRSNDSRNPSLRITLKAVETFGNSKDMLRATLTGQPSAPGAPPSPAKQN